MIAAIVIEKVEPSIASTREDRDPMLKGRSNREPRGASGDLILNKVIMRFVRSWFWNSRGVTAAHRGRGSSMITSNRDPEGASRTMIATDFLVEIVLS